MKKFHATKFDFSAALLGVRTGAQVEICAHRSDRRICATKIHSTGRTANKLYYNTNKIVGTPTCASARDGQFIEGNWPVCRILQRGLGGGATCAVHMSPSFHRSGRSSPSLLHVRSRSSLLPTQVIQTSYVTVRFLSPGWVHICDLRRFNMTDVMSPSAVHLPVACAKIDLYAP